MRRVSVSTLRREVAASAIRAVSSRIDAAQPQARLAVVLAAWDTARSHRVRERLNAHLAEFAQVTSECIVVNNCRRTEFPGSIRGSNSAHEFSAYDEGILAHRERHGAPDLWLLLNDRVLSRREQLGDIVNVPALFFALNTDAAVGWIDRVPRHRILDHPSDFHVRSNAILLPNSSIEKLTAMTTVTGDLRRRLDLALPQKFPGKHLAPFEFAEVDASLAGFIHGWLTSPGAWYQAQPLSADYWPEYRRKVLAILNEHLLTARLRQLNTHFATPLQATLLGMSQMSERGLAIPMATRAFASKPMRGRLERWLLKLAFDAPPTGAGSDLHDEEPRAHRATPRRSPR